MPVMSAKCVKETTIVDVGLLRCHLVLFASDLNEDSVQA
jgi:hypothetical protein